MAKTIKLVASLNAEEAAEYINKVLKDSGLSPVACKALNSARPGKTIRAEFREPVLVWFHLLNSGKILVESEVDDDGILSKDILYVEPTFLEKGEAVLRKKTTELQTLSDLLDSLPRFYACLNKALKALN